MSGRVRVTRRGACLIALLLVLSPGVASLLATQITGVDDQGFPVHHQTSTAKEPSR